MPHVKRHRSTRRRLALAFIVTLAIMSVFTIRLIDLQVVRADELNDESRDKRAVAVTERAPRGAIVDRDGVVLAQSVTRYDITISPKHAKEFRRSVAEGEGTELVSVFQALQEIAEITGAELEPMLATIKDNPESNHAYLVRSVGTEEYRAVRELRIPWVYPQSVPERTYPN